MYVGNCKSLWMLGVVSLHVEPEDSSSSLCTRRAPAPAHPPVQSDPSDPTRLSIGSLCFYIRLLTYNNKLGNIKSMHTN